MARSVQAMLRRHSLVVSLRLCYTRVLDQTLQAHLLIRVSHRWSAWPDQVLPVIWFFPSILWALEGRALRFGGG